MPDFDSVIRALQLPSPLTQIFSKELRKKEIRLFIKREDLIHAEISGNKWRKLYLNLLQAKKENKKTIVTFGGAYSNHIYATAAACSLLGFQSIGIIRGEMVDHQNPTLTFAQSKGMKLIRVSREDYKDKTKLADEFDEAYIVPEGGNNLMGRNGMRVLAQELKKDFCEKRTQVVLAIGTGCTMGGLINFLPDNFSVLGINVLRNIGIDRDIEDWIDGEACCYEVNHNYHFGGYAKTNEALVNFINAFSSEHKIALDPIYTSKMLYAIFDLIDKDYFKKGDCIVALHTGGLQGIEPFNQRYGKKYGVIK